jgi:hypothetical protein
MFIKRELTKSIEKYLFKGKILMLFGPRQVGKTTLVKKLLEEHNSEEGYYNCEILSVKRQLEREDPYSTKKFLGDHKIIVLDEAQRITNIGLVLKQLIDTFPNIQIIATGSSSFDLANKINEPLTGRALEFKLYPLSVQELLGEYSKVVVSEKLDDILIYGLYPEVYLSSRDLSIKLLENISSNYLYKDILELQEVKKSSILVKLLELLALQLGSEVSINELALKLQVNHNTVERYIDLLEKAFVIFRLRGFSRNLRKEISKKDKIYFYDIGIRNAILNRFNRLELRDDVGALWENFLIVERRKYLGDSHQFNQYFWRTHDRKEIDYIEEREGKIEAYEFKWNKTSAKKPSDFFDAYPESSFEVINRNNFFEFVS